MAVRLDRIGLIGAALMVVGHSPVVAAELPAASVDEVVAGVRSCAAATTPAGVDEAALKDDGWHQGTMSDKGKAVFTPFTFYGKGGLMLFLQKEAKNPVCLFSARLAGVSDFPELQAAFTARYGAPVKDDGKGEQTFITPDHRIVDLASTGNQAKPAVRVAVGPVFQESK